MSDHELERDERQAEIQTLRRKAELADELAKALSFYADKRRYRGSNQEPIEGDEFQPERLPYMLDVTRDGGEIAKSALAKFEGVAK